MPDYAGQYEMIRRLYGVLPSLTRIGVGRLVPSLSANDVPGRAGQQASAFANDSRSARAARDEVATYRRSFTQAQGLTDLGTTPLVVLTANDSMTGTPGWPVAQQQLAALSSNADLRTVDSSHGGLLDHPRSYPASVTAITDVIRAVRSGTAVTAP
jgi:hypothetical protein